MNRNGLILVFAVSICFGQSSCNWIKNKPAQADFEKVSLCQLFNDLGAFHHKSIEIEAFASHGFEDSSIFDPGCGARYSGIWMEYGGTSGTGTTYCCDVPPEKTRPAILTVEGIPLPLLENDNFKILDALLHKDRGRVVRATLRGTFFAPKQARLGNSGPTEWGGFGHMGCCGLFVIQEVVSVFPQKIDGIDYASSLPVPDREKEGCDLYESHFGEDWESLVAQQQAADRGSDTWRFDQPKRVGSEGLAKLLDESPDRIKLDETLREDGRIIYYWRPKGRKGVRYMIVVNRPYVLSFEAQEPSKIVWTVAEIFTVCTDLK